MVAIDRIYERLCITPGDIEAFCRKWHIIEFALFGSVVRDDFRPDSDIDVMVVYQEQMRPRGLDYFTPAVELEQLLGRPVDLLEKGPIENPYRRRSILRDLTPIYAA